MGNELLLPQYRIIGLLVGLQFKGMLLQPM